LNAVTLRPTAQIHYIKTDVYVHLRHNLLCLLANKWSLGHIGLELFI